MKRIFVLSAALVLGFALLAGPALAKTLVVAHDTNFKPFEFKDEKGKYTGFDIELWKEIAKRLGLEYKMQPMDFNGIIPGLQTSQVDVGIAAMTITDERAKVALAQAGVDGPGQAEVTGHGVCGLAGAQHVAAHDAAAAIN